SVLYMQSRPKRHGNLCRTIGLGDPLLLVSDDGNARHGGDGRGPSGGPNAVTAKAGMLTYKRARFGTRLPTDRFYTRAHYWLLETDPAVWRVGFTKFATRMLGDIVEYQFEVPAEGRVAIGQKLGWIEGFKAVSDIYSVAEGFFSGENPDLLEDITLLESDPYERGWLYAVRGRPDLNSVDANRYATILDATIDKMLASRHNAEGHE
ncbi:MAG: glycine cleavage system protein H, partial [Bryobacteraceae bacterium]